MIRLPDALLRLPLAHRGLHDAGAGRCENSPAAVRAAVAAGYGIEIDLQLSADGQAMVFHDYDLGRLTAETGPVRGRDAADLGRIALGPGGGTIPTLAEVLEMVAGRVPLLIEIKDQDGALGPETGTLEAATAVALAEYAGPVAVMSFNPHAVAAFGQAAPRIPRGLVTDDFDSGNWGLVPEARRTALRAIPDFDAVGASFISHDARDLDSPAVTALRERGVPILCWTVRSAAEERAARRVADNITFEGYRPETPAA